MLFLALASSSTLDSIRTSSSEPTSSSPLFEQEKLNGLVFEFQKAEVDDSAVTSTLSRSQPGSRKIDKVATTGNSRIGDQNLVPPAVPPRNVTTFSNTRHNELEATKLECEFFFLIY